MKYIAIIESDEKPVSCEFIGCNGNVNPYLIGATTNIKPLEKEPKTGHWIEDDFTGLIKCDICGNDAYMDVTSGEQCKSNYCPFCGLKMESEVEE